MRRKRSRRVLSSFASHPPSLSRALAQQDSGALFVGLRVRRLSGSMDIEGAPQDAGKGTTMEDHPPPTGSAGGKRDRDEGKAQTASSGASATSTSSRARASADTPGGQSPSNPVSSSSSTPGLFADPLVRVFAVLMLVQAVLFAEAGAVPALLVQLASAFKLTFPEQGYLGGIVYFGIAVGAPITSEFFKCANPKHVLFWTLLVEGKSSGILSSLADSAEHDLLSWQQRWGEGGLRRLHTSSCTWPKPRSAVSPRL